MINYRRYHHQHPGLERGRRGREYGVGSGSEWEKKEEDILLHSMDTVAFLFITNLLACIWHGSLRRQTDLQFGIRACERIGVLYEFRRERGCKIELIIERD